MLPFRYLSDIYHCTLGFWIHSRLISGCDVTVWILLLIFPCRFHGCTLECVSPLFVGTLKIIGPTPLITCTGESQKLGMCGLLMDQVGLMDIRNILYKRS